VINLAVLSTAQHSFLAIHSFQCLHISHFKDKQDLAVVFWLVDNVPSVLVQAFINECYISPSSPFGVRYPA
jgi:hypothetical protein